MANAKEQRQEARPAWWRRRPAALAAGGVALLAVAAAALWLGQGLGARAAATTAGAIAPPPQTTLVEVLPWSFGGLSLPARLAVARSTDRSASRPYWFAVELWQGVWKQAYSTWLAGPPQWAAGPPGPGEPRPLLVWANGLATAGSWEVRLLGSRGDAVVELLDQDARQALWLAPPIVKGDGVFVPGVPPRQLVWSGDRVTLAPASVAAALPSGATMVSYYLANGQLTLDPPGPVTVAVGQELWLVPGDQTAAAAWTGGQIAMDTATPPAATPVRRGVFLAGAHDVGTVVIDLWYGPSTLPAARLTVQVTAPGGH